MAIVFGACDLCELGTVVNKPDKLVFSNRRASAPLMIDNCRTLFCIHHVAELLEVGEHAALRSRLVSWLTWLVATTPV
jgi:hypothetical protein